MQDAYDFIVIGSGFGGSVSAMRLAEKGYRVAVLEAGRRWHPEDFPETNTDIRRSFWAPRLGCLGLLRIRLFGHFMSLGGAGVGGGSLNYGCVLVEPMDPFFRDPQWADLDPDWKATLGPHYETARRMLGVTPNPRLAYGDRLLQDYADRIGRSDSFGPTPVGIFFGKEPGMTVPDPYFGGEGPERTSCDFGAACMIGCRTGAKNTLDRNYLYFAERYGAGIVPETLVTEVRPCPDGGYIVSSRHPGGFFPRGRREWRAAQVVFAGGTLGTMELLFAMRERGYLPNLSARLGYRLRTNSEVICGVEARDRQTRFCEGVAIGSIVRVNERTSIEAVRYNRGSNVMGGLSTLLVDEGTGLSRPLKWLRTCLSHPVDLFRNVNPRGWADRSLILLVMQVVENSLRMVYRRSRIRPWRRVLASTSPEGGIPTFIPEANHAARNIAARCNAIPCTALSEVLLNRPLTAHVIGGCCMGADPADGVVDRHGRLFGHPGLYVVDGSIISANLGSNPALTITALAEHVMSAIPPADGANR